MEESGLFQSIDFDENALEDNNKDKNKEGNQNGNKNEINDEKNNDNKGDNNISEYFCKKVFECKGTNK